MNTPEEYVTYAQAKALKELGFDWPCRRFYPLDDELRQVWPDPIISMSINSERDNSCTAPTQAVACRWLRKEKGIILTVIPGCYGIGWLWEFFKSDGSVEKVSFDSFPTYEGALSAGIDRALEILTSNNTIQ